MRHIISASEARKLSEEDILARVGGHYFDLKESCYRVGKWDRSEDFSSMRFAMKRYKRDGTPAHMGMGVTPHEAIQDSARMELYLFDTQKERDDWWVGGNPYAPNHEKLTIPIVARKRKPDL